jgi:hypothetical protein
MDVLEAKVGHVTPEAITRMLYLDAMQSTKPEPMQTFYLRDIEKKYYESPILSDPRLSKLQQEVLPYSILKNLNFYFKKLIIDNITKNINIGKQNKWA